MKHLPILLLALAAFSACNTQESGKCIIKGVINAEDKRDSCYVFLVPQGPHEASEVDSTLILNGSFEFTVEEERMAIVRVTKYRRLGLQDLLVVTEPGTVRVELSGSSNGGGTEQNDSLQVWKTLTEQYNLDSKSILSEEGRKVLREEYKKRTHEIAHGCGDGSTLGKFLLGLYPEKN